MFDPAITVHEFLVTDYEKRGGGKWWTEDEMEEFKREAVQRIRARCVDIIPTGTGRAFVPGIVTGNSAAAKRNNNISFNHPALGFEDEFDPELRNERVKEIMGYITQEIRSILVVDPHPIFHSLFRKSLKHMLPFIAIASAQSAEEALTRIEAAQRAFSMQDGGSSHGFDVIIIEENLIDAPVIRMEDVSAQSVGDDSVQRITSGSSLVSHIAKSQRELKLKCDDNDELRLTLIIGVSAQLIDHRERLETAGADIVWGKPPPEMNATLRNSLLRTIMTKRGRRVEFKVFDC
jgi:CheY-like chemotaxis protein